MNEIKNTETSKGGSKNSKQRWIDNNYTQVKVSVKPEIAAEFKNACINTGTSMASVLSEFMLTYNRDRKVKSQARMNKVTFDLSTRRQRRETMQNIIKVLGAIKSSEEQYLLKMPVNLQSSENYEKTEELISSVESAIEILETVYE